MKKTELTPENQERINFAVKQGLGVTDWKLIHSLSGGLTGVPVYKIEVGNLPYVIKLDDISDKNFDLVRCYLILETVAKQGIAPPVYFTDASRGIILMKFIDSKPHLQASSESAKNLASVIRKLHDGSSFEKWKPVTEILNHFYQKLSARYQQINIISICMREAIHLEKYVSDASDIRPSHCDLNPNNVLFDGKNYLLVDWQAASPQNLYFDLACCAIFFYFYSDELYAEFLKHYFGREMTADEINKCFMMKIFANIYYGIIFISLSQESIQPIDAPSDEDIAQLPTYFEFMQSIGSGKANLSDAVVQQQFGFVFLKTALEEIMSQKYKNSCRL